MSAPRLGSRVVTRPDGGYWRPTDFEVVASWVHGRVAAPVSDGSGPRDPIDALEAAILPALVRAPCFVAFSGGRDSSAVLAVATDLARRHGLPDPVPVTELYPGIPESDESEWQHLVVAHLGLDEWVRLEFGHGNDLLGSDAQASLRRRGLIWPVALHVKTAVLARLGGSGSLLTGEGGDEVLGRRRGYRVSRTWRRDPRSLRPRDLRAAGSALAPLPYRRVRERVRLDRAALQPWLSPETRLRHHRLLAADLASERLTTAGSLEWLLTRRAAVMATHNYTRLAADYGVSLHEPLLDATFVRSLAEKAGTWGFVSRTAAMRELFGPLLPDAVLERRTKAYFNRAFMGEETRAFARSWDGTGVDPQLVDVEVLAAEWAAEVPSAMSTPLLHAAWLSSASAHTGSAR